MIWFLKLNDNFFFLEGLILKIFFIYCSRNECGNFCNWVFCFYFNICVYSNIINNLNGNYLLFKYMIFFCYVKIFWVFLFLFEKLKNFKIK